MAEEFKFPDEIEDQKQSPQEEVKAEAPQVEIEIEDDRPIEDQKNATPLPKEIVEEIDKDDLEEYSKEAKQRLLQMKKLINDERRAKEQAIREQEEAVRVAQSLVEETKKLKGRLTEGEKVYVSTAKENANRELEAVKREIKEALEAGDSDKLIEAQEKLMAAKMKSQEIERYKHFHHIVAYNAQFLEISFQRPSIFLVLL